MDRNRLLSLAMEALERQKTAIDVQIENVRAELDGIGTIVEAKAKPARKPRKRRSRTLAERRAQSLKMKAVWAKRKAAQRAIKSAAEAKKTASLRKLKAEKAQKKASSLKKKPQTAKPRARKLEKKKPAATKPKASPNNKTEKKAQGPAPSGTGA